MAKDYGDGDGRWVTINGRRVFIAEGQSLGDAMKKSGKFEKVSKVKGVRKNTFKDEISQGDKNKFAMGQGLSKEAVKGYAKARQDEREKSDKVDVPGFKGYEYDKKTGEVKSKDYSEKEAQNRVKDVEARNRENYYSQDEQDILDRFSEDYGYDKGDNLKNLKGQIDYMRNPGDSIHRTAERLVEGRDFLIYNGDVKDYLDERGIKYNEDNFFDKYKKDMADKIEKLYNSDSSKTKADRNIDAMDDKETRRRIAEATNKELKEIIANNQKQKNNEYMSKVAEESGKNKESGVIQRAVSRMTPQQKAKTFEARLRQRGQDLDEERAYYTQDRMNKIIDKQNMSDKAKASAKQNLNTWKPAKSDKELRNRYSEDIAYDKGATPNASSNDTRHLNAYKRVELNRIKNMLSGEKVYDTRNGKNVGDARNLKEDKESTSKIFNDAVRNRKVMKAYQNYIKKHPNSQLKLNEFKDLYQG